MILKQESSHEEREKYARGGMNLSFTYQSLTLFDFCRKNSVIIAYVFFLRNTINSRFILRYLLSSDSVDVNECLRRENKLSNTFLSHRTWINEKVATLYIVMDCHPVYCVKCTLIQHCTLYSYK